MPVDSTTKTAWEDRASTVYLLDPSTGKPAAAATASTEVDPAARHNPAAVNTISPVNLPAPGAGKHWVIGSVEWGYSGAPTGGQLTITDGGVEVFRVYITAGGPGSFSWNPAKRFTDNAAVVVSLAAGGAGVSGCVNVHAWVG